LISPNADSIKLFLSPLSQNKLECLRAQTLTVSSNMLLRLENLTLEKGAGIFNGRFNDKLKSFITLISGSQKVQKDLFSSAYPSVGGTETA
jgi:hypothetical protein